MRSFSLRPNRTVIAAISLLLTALVITLSATSIFAVHADSLYDLRQKQNELQAQKEATDSRLAELRDDVSKKKEYRDDLYKKIAVVQEEIDNLRQQIEALDEQIADAERSIAIKKESISDNYELLKERLRAIYMTGEASKVEMLLNSDSLMDYSRKNEILKAVTAHDNNLIEMLSDQLAEIEKELNIITANKEELSEKKKEQDAKGVELGELYAEAQAILIEAENKADAVRANSDGLDSELSDVAASIAELEEEIKNMYGGSGGGYVGTGGFVWPMPGFSYITCYFGEGGHRGTDIAGSGIYGKPVIAADGGFVEYAGWHYSYGYCVFINHGNGYQTRYAHMSSLAVSSGTNVGQAQTLGYCGSTGNSTGPHLHFEVIYNGSLQDPFNYF